MPWSRSPRAKLFFLVFLTLLVPGAIWVFMQEPVYRSGASVLMSTPSAIDAEVGEADVQNVAIQRRILLGQEVTARTREALPEGLGTQLELPDLAELLDVNAIPETNLVEMSARGGDRDLLPPLVNTWIDVYLEMHALEVKRAKERTSEMVSDQLAELDIKLEQARLDLAAFREEHEIISAERQENDILARLEGLNKALNTAIEAEVNAGARVKSMQAAIDRGESLLPRDEQRGLDRLETELQELEAQSAALSRRYTQDYIDNPNCGQCWNA